MRLRKIVDYQAIGFRLDVNIRQMTFETMLQRSEGLEIIICLGCRRVWYYLQLRSESF